jgi:hypothetical protein
MRYEKAGFNKYSFQSDRELTLVFFTHPSSYYIQLREVKRRGTVITVRYQATPHFTPESSVHFALIPLGKLPAAEYNVMFEQERMDSRFVEAGFIQLAPLQEQRLVCRSFSFVIWDPPSEELAKPDPKAKLVPLSEVWALKMPGTKNVRELDGEGQGIARSTTNRMASWLINNRPRPIEANVPPTRASLAGPGFAVIGTEADSLRQAANKLIQRPRRGRERFLSGSSMTVVFFAHPTAGYVHLHAVEVAGTDVTIKYRIVPHRTKESTTHFALIPLGKLPAGEYRVRMVLLPPPEEAGKRARPFDPGIAARDVCGDFTFLVGGDG